MDKISFTVNGDHYSLAGPEVGPFTSLNEYLREHLHLFGTKAMCHEGGCGTCIVSVARVHPGSKEKQVIAVNSCLVHVLSCHQWDITTIEGLGSRVHGYHDIQQRLAMFNGTQCGYCTPGWVMNMYSLKESTKKLTVNTVEKSFGGNLCRCTGYRPILDAFKSFANDACDEIKSKLLDIEDLSKCSKTCRSRDNSELEDWCVISDTSLVQLHAGTSRWYKAYTIKDVFKILNLEKIDSYRLIAGNTGKGVYPITQDPKIQIDISSIESLKECLKDDNLVVGAGMSLTDTMMEFQNWSKSEEFAYLAEFYKHLDLVAHVPVRNLATIGGNLAMKNAHNEFASDIFLLLETVSATVTIMDDKLKTQEMNMMQFLTTDLKYKLILNVKLPPLSPKYFIRTYKIMPRAQNAHAIVNCGFLLKLDPTTKVLKSNLVFGSMGSKFTRASKTADALIGQILTNEETLSKALAVLEGELKPTDGPPEASPLCKKTIALGLFYRTILSLSTEVNPRYKSGDANITRGISRGTQTFDTDKSLWPLNQPVPKLEAITQCSGEARYSCDTTRSPRDLHVAPVLSDVCVADIEGFDATEALKTPGVVSFLTAKDIPGKNDFTPTDAQFLDYPQEILASKKVLYHGQPVALVTAVNRVTALTAAGLVKVKYRNVKKDLVLTIADALVAPDKEKRLKLDANTAAKDKGNDIVHTITGSYDIPSQYHFTLETQSCVVTNTENGVLVRSATQWIDLVQIAVARCLNLDENQVEVSVARIGGGYGGKASQSAMTACACALAARAAGRAARLTLTLSDNMRAAGKRSACRAYYEVNVNAVGVVQSATITLYSDCGSSFNDSPTQSIASTLASLYNTDRFTVKGYSVLTDMASNTWCRAPGTTESVALMEHIMERIAFATKQDPIEIRYSNVLPANTHIKDMVTALKTESNFDDRKLKIAQFNDQNAWKKKALKLSVMAFPVEFVGSFPVLMSICHGDGTVSISHGGIEMGQGINTKVAQVCAYKLKIPLDKVKVHATTSVTSPNSLATNGSITSDSVAYATVKACDELLKRLGTCEGSWLEKVKQAYSNGVNLQCNYMMYEKELANYTILGACVCEVELDVLTGVHNVARVDIMEDTGVSLSPDIDIGQIEGAFIMGLGMWTHERLVYSQQTGGLLTDTTWSYKPPGARDVPEDFRVTTRDNAAAPGPVLRSKATGEPALTLSVVVTMALQECCVEARREFGYQDTEWLHIDSPYTVENILKAISSKIEKFKIK